jgi:hypothetical protein
MLTLWVQLLCGVPIVAHHEDNCTAGSVAFPKVVDHCDRLRSTPVAVPQLSLVRSRIDASIFAMCVAVLNMSPPFPAGALGKVMGRLAPGVETRGKVSSHCTSRSAIDPVDADPIPTNADLLNPIHHAHARDKEGRCFGRSW